MGESEIEWSRVRRILVVRLRSIGDTVLSTPALIELRRFLPDARIDILLEDWVAPLLRGFDTIDDVIEVGLTNASRLAVGRHIRQQRYDAVFNLHGGTTSTFLTFATGARHRIGYRHYQYSFLHNYLIGSSADFWKRDRLHSVEQQLALLGSVGIPVRPDIRTRLPISADAMRSVETKFLARASRPLDSIGAFVLVHPTAAFTTKQWPTENFARVAEFVSSKGLTPIAVAASDETIILDKLRNASRAPIIAFDDLTLPEITAIASRAKLFVGNDSGIAHIAAAVGTPCVVIFGSSNRDHWRPWTDASHEVVYAEFTCQPCPGHECREFGEPRCILNIKPESVFDAVDRVLRKSQIQPISA